MTNEFRLIGWGAEELVEDILFFAVILLLMTLIRVFYSKTKINFLFPESTILIIIGLVSGMFVEYISF